MKKYLFFFTIEMLLYAMRCNAQCTYSQNFELGIDNHIGLDTNQTKNIWQVGKPNKIIFNSSNNFTRSIVTDTINPYPINDTSSFYLSDTGSWVCCLSCFRSFTFAYRTNTDTLKDYGFIECSVNGGNWFNLTDTLYKLGYLSSPILSGNTGGQSFPNTLGQFSSTQDTVLLKFTFISDSIQTNKDGWIIDDIVFDIAIGTPEINQLQINSFAFPNPAVNDVTIDIQQATNTMRLELAIMDCLGRKVYEEKNIRKPKIKIDIKNFNQGIYFYKLTNTETLQSGKGNFIVTK